MHVVFGGLGMVTRKLALNELVVNGSDQHTLDFQWSTRMARFDTVYMYKGFAMQA